MPYNRKLNFLNKFTFSHFVLIFILYLLEKIRHIILKKSQSKLTSWKYNIIWPYDVGLWCNQRSKYNFNKWYTCTQQFLRLNKFTQKYFQACCFFLEFYISRLIHVPPAIQIHQTLTQQSSEVSLSDKRFFKCLSIICFIIVCNYEHN